MKRLIGFFIVLGIQHLFAQCNGTEPVIDLGPNTTICSGNTLALSAPVGFNSYQWSNGTTTPNLTVTNSGTYFVTGIMDNSATTNLVLNGDFEAGTTAAVNNFTTAYIPGTAGSWGLLSNPGTFVITTSPILGHNNYSVCGDHTSGFGNMFVANGASIANSTVWQQPVAVSQGKDYFFSFWACNAVNDLSVSQLQLFINNTAISLPVSLPTSDCNWVQITGSWNSGNYSNANLKIVNLTSAAGGNDFAIDDISFKEKCKKTDTIEINVNQPQDTSLLVTTLDQYSLNGQVYNSSGVYTQTIQNSFGCDSIVTLILILNYTGNDELEKISSYNIYPNPAKNIINLNSNQNHEDSEIELFNTMGQKLGSFLIRKGENSIDISELQSGMYYFKFVGDDLSIIKWLKM